MLTTTLLARTPRLFALVWLTSAAALQSLPAVAQQPLAEATAQSLIEALDSAPMSRSFNRTALPDSSTNQCAAGKPAGSSAGSSRNLEVVPYAGDTTPGVNLDVQFVSGSDKLSARDQTLLGNLATALKDARLKDKRFAIAGHTDSTGTDKLNLELSCARSLAVRAYLLTRGIGADRVSAYGFGSARPLAGAAGNAAQNRRVEVRVAP